MNSVRHSKPQKQLLDIPTLFTHVFILVDDWFKQHPRQGVGRKPLFSDSEVLTLLLMMDFLPYPSERQHLAYVRANHLDLFSRLLDQSQFNVRSRALRYRLEQLRQHWHKKLVKELQAYLLMDSKPVPVLSYKRNKDHSDFLGSANYGVCTSRALKYFGYKLIMLATLEGVPVCYDLLPANTDERLAAEQLLEQVRHCQLLCDKGFIGAFWQQEVLETLEVRVMTAKRKNQQEQNPQELDTVVGSLRQRMEGVFNELQNLGKNLERLLAKTVVGLGTRVAALVTSHTLKLFLRKVYHMDVQTFSFID
jgi:hypothetical protein